MTLPQTNATELKNLKLVFNSLYPGDTHKILKVKVIVKWFNTHDCRTQGA